MPKLIFVSHDGNEHAVDAKSGTTLMNAALDNGVPGIDGDCGGECSCGTCHVMVDRKWLDKVGSTSGFEESMLSMNAEREESSRLSCQIIVSDKHDGLRIVIPAHQM